jgi:hypothetical protein
MMLDHTPTREEQKARWDSYKVLLFWDTKKNILPIAWVKFAFKQLSQFSEFCELYNLDMRNLSPWNYEDFFAYCYKEAGLAHRFFQVRRICDLFELGGRVFGHRAPVRHLMHFYASVLNIPNDDFFKLPDQALDAVEDIIEAEKQRRKDDFYSTIHINLKENL